MTHPGQYALFIAHALAVWGCVAAVAATVTKDRRYLESAIRSIHGISILLVLAVGMLVRALLADDFTLTYVWEYSRRSQPFIYKWTALWGGNAGSLLFWAALLAVFSSLAMVLNRKVNERILPFASLILLLTLGFFLFLLAGLPFVTDASNTNPFQVLQDASGRAVTDPELIDGHGMNPLLQNPYMAIHPPTLFLGYVGFAIPFALLLGALFHRESRTSLYRSARNWAMFSWLTLGLGIILGAYWAYIELGWGGYWAWDPVENASLLPWLTGTAFLHSFIMQEKRGIFRLWNVLFISITFLLSIFGTYLTRSGVLQSVHAFGQADDSIPWFMQLGNVFLGFMGMMIVLAAWVVVSRRKMLKGDAHLESAASRESMFLYSNILFSLFTFMVLFGVTSPIFYRLWTGQELHRGPEFYNARAIPIGLLLLLAMGISCVAPWRKGRWQVLAKRIAVPAAMGAASFAISLCAFLWVPALREQFSEQTKATAYLVVCIALCTMVPAILLQEYFRHVLYARSRRGKGILPALASPVRANPRRYGGYLVHGGVVLMFLGIGFSSVYQRHFEEGLEVGGTMRAGAYELRLAALESDDLSADLNKVNEIRVWAEVEVLEGGRTVSILRPMRVYYAANPEQPMYEVAIHSTPSRDVYTILAGFDVTKGTIVLGVFVNPLVAWIWIGGLLLLFGGLIAFIPMGRI